VSEAGAATSADSRSFHAAAVRATVERYLTVNDFPPAQRALIEDGLRSYLQDQSIGSAVADFESTAVSRPTLALSSEEMTAMAPIGDGGPYDPSIPPNQLPPPGPPEAGGPDPGEAPDFDEAPESDEEPATDGGGVVAQPQPVLPIGGITCLPGNELLLGGRFVVQATVTDLLGNVFIAGACRMTNVAGYFFFFDPTNVEVPVKMLNACIGGNPASHWIFITGLTNFGVRTTFFDLFSGISLTHTNPVGQTFPSSINQGTPFPCP
jgi:hypothetical protein